ncbi:MAG: glycosyltransferase [Muribaculaceae bacterium]|nr:glycosyltransferase [Muribaculaceae bacterium]
MPKLLQINVTANWGSTGKIAEEIGKLAINAGWESYIAYGRGRPVSKSRLIRVGNDYDMYSHILRTRLFDSHGLASRHATLSLIKKIKLISPDIIHLHNIHGYYLNYPILFEYLKNTGIPVVWTLHDCWTFSGHCAHHLSPFCDKWKTECNNCVRLSSYPASIWKDRSKRNFFQKKESFSSLPNLTLVPVSYWLQQELSSSFLADYHSFVIHNGIDLSIFTPSDNQISKQRDYYSILGVSSVWEARKGLDDFIKLRYLLPDNFHITLVGLSPKQIKSLPPGIKGITRTQSVEELRNLYREADIFVNPTLEDTYPTTNLEAMACGTPVLTYATGGSPESIGEATGEVIDYGDVKKLAERIRKVCETHPYSSGRCRAHAEAHFDKNQAFQKYLELYNKLI